MSGFHLLQLDNTPILQQLRIEEALLRADTRNWCIVNKGSTPAIVMGISGKKEELVNAEAHAKTDIPIIRRFSGGGTVVVDEETLFVTWIANTADIRVPCCPKKIMEWTADLYKPVFSGVNFHLVENDYAIDHKKCGGNAQYLCKDRWLHHSSFLWNYTSENMRLLKMPPKMPEYRQQRPHEEFLCRLGDHFPCRQSFLEQFLSHIKNSVELTTANPAEIQNLLQAPHRRATLAL